MSDAEVLVVGAGPNGLSAAIAAARAGCSVLILEAEPTAGGAARTEALTLPGFLHDFGSAVHPLAALSPFFRTLPLEQFGLSWVQPEIPLAHPLPDKTAAILLRSIEETAARLGADGTSYARHMRAPVEALAWLTDDLPHGRLPRHPASVLRWAAASLLPASTIAHRWFRSPGAQALIAGIGAHSALSLDRRGTGALALVLLAAAHLVGWPFPRGGAQQITSALLACLHAHGGKVQTDCPIRSLADLPPARTVFWDITPRQLLSILGDALPASYRRALARFHYGPGACKVDWALAEPIPWLAGDCQRAGTVHLGGTFDEIARGEAELWRGMLPREPYVLLSQPSLFDPMRAPRGRHTAWAYCHVPNGCQVSMADAIEAQVERFAPGFRELILARRVHTAPQLEARDANLVGGDVSGGLHDLRQLLFRPTARWHSMPLAGHYLCSSSTPPGGGVHGMCGYLAARRALGSRVTLRR
jgi:phytoene dehydrogenase-like protein